MGHQHGGTSRAASGGERHVRPLAVTFGLVAVFLVVEAVGGFLTNSLALLSDAGHMLTDAVGLGMALGAITTASRVAGGRRRTYGLYRLEILAALANAALLFGVAGFVLWEAGRRFMDPPEVASGAMLAVATAGLVVNLVSWQLLRAGASESLNVEGALLEVLADLVGSVGVIVAAAITLTTGWAYADPLFGAGIGLFILPRAWRLGGRALRVLVQAAPPEIDLEALRADLEELDGVLDVHDLHVWTLTSEMDVASLHLMTEETRDAHAVLDEANALLRDRYRIGHATLQVEPASHGECVETSW
ncbi:MAG: cation diffusion facilitator family transporter [Dehalococcoidia bacterium]